MANKKKRVDAAKQREKRTKIAAIIGVVLLVAVAAYEVPSMLAVMNKKAPPGSTYDPGPSSVLPNVSGGTAAPASTSGQLVNTDQPPSTDTGQLVSFSVFQTKNPFTPQVSDAQAPSDSGAAPTTANKPGADVPTGTTATSTTPTTTTPGPTVLPPTSSPPATTTPTTTTATPAQPTVAISVNGVTTHVGNGGTFPTGAPVFRLVSWSNGTAQIGIVGGSYASGDATIALRVGTPLTLENQTDGKRYRIELLSTP